MIAVTKVHNVQSESRQQYFPTMPHSLRTEEDPSPYYLNQTTGPCIARHTQGVPRLIYLRWCLRGGLRQRRYVPMVCKLSVPLKKTHHQIDIDREGFVNYAHRSLCKLHTCIRIHWIEYIFRFWLWWCTYLLTPLLLASACAPHYALCISHTISHKRRMQENFTGITYGYIYIKVSRSH